MIFASFGRLTSEFIKITLKSLESRQLSLSKYMKREKHLFKFLLYFKFEIAQKVIEGDLSHDGICKMAYIHLKIVTIIKSPT